MGRIDPLVSTGWLEEHLHEPGLRIYDCTALFSAPDGKMHFDSGAKAYAEGHIPGAGFIDVLDALSDEDSSLTTQRLGPQDFAKAMSAYGIGDGIRAVLYDQQMSMWATRVWWMLRAMGFDDAAVLDGGWHKWTKEGRPVSTQPDPIPAASFVPRPRPELFADKDIVRSAIGEDGAAIVSALTPELHAGEGLDIVERGHIASSTCVPFTDIVDPETMAYLPLEELRRKFDGSGVTPDKKAITYCGCGIAATSDAFALHLLGQDVAVYDGSIEEWSSDPDLPMEKS